MSSKLFVVVGGQLGSEGKGAVTGRICSDLSAAGRSVVNVRVGGPNAGHSVVGNCPPGCDGQEEMHGPHEVDKHPWRLRQVPVAAVTNPEAQLVIGAGSEVDPEVLRDEVQQLNSAGYEVSRRLWVDRSATALSPSHVAAEHHRGISRRLGSTAKGIGAARAERIWREADTWVDYVEKNVDDDEVLGYLNVGDTVGTLNYSLRNTSDAVVIEGTQGYGLGLHTENYPFTTSGDCRAIDFLAQAGVSPWLLNSYGGALHPKVVVCARPHPIRVAGNSGALKGETDWEALGLPAEYTTVTQKVRRVGGWDPQLVRDAVRANGGPRHGVVWLALTMMDSVDPELTGVDLRQRGWVWPHHPAAAEIYLESTGTDWKELGYVGTGPDTALVNERMYD